MIRRQNMRLHWLKDRVTERGTREQEEWEMFVACLVVSQRSKTLWDTLIDYLIDKCTTDNGTFVMHGENCQPLATIISTNVNIAKTNGK